MKTRRCWGWTILVRWFKLCLLAAAATAQAASLESLAAAFRKNPTGANRAALLAYAAQKGPSQEGALARLVVGSVDAAGGNAQSAIPLLREAKSRLRSLQDYTGFHLANALYRTGAYEEALAELEPAIAAQPVSPLRAQALLLSARIHLESGRPDRAVALLRNHAAELPVPSSLELLARGLERSGNSVEAARIWQRIWCEHPTSGEAGRAASALERLRQALGARFPPLSAEMRFTRIDRLLAAREYEMARRELQQMTTTLSGAARDRARVWLGRARHLRSHDAIAFQWLGSLKVASPEADAERLYYLVASSRRLGRVGDMLQALAQLNKRHPKSPWRLEALVAVGNHFLLANDVSRYEPLFRTCAETFPSDAKAAYCHWKVTWAAYLGRRPEARSLLREHLRRYPHSEKADAALYFLGRLAQEAGETAAARAWFEEVKREYPNRYYATLAEQRLREADIKTANPSQEVQRFLENVEFPPRSRTHNFEPDRITQIRLGRGRLLRAAGLADWAETELRFGARTDAQAPLLAMELARAAVRKQEYGKSIRYIKSLVPGYLWMPFESAPEEFWRLAYPLHYKDQLLRYARARDLDLFFLAALIRQESEFDARAVSRAKAIGLTQVLPSTGRELSRKLGFKRFTPSMLYRPDVNLNLGTYYLRHLLDTLDGHVEAALASYNAGLSRARLWLSWADYREPAEFIETIPITETRNYVAIVLRNAEIYRRLYADEAGEALVATLVSRPARAAGRILGEPQ